MDGFTRESLATEVHFSLGGARGARQIGDLDPSPLRDERKLLIGHGEYPFPDTALEYNQVRGAGAGTKPVTNETVACRVLSG